MDDLDWTDTASKNVAMGSDGASVMLRVKHGVAAVLKEANPSVVPVDCHVYRFIDISNSYLTSLFNLYYNEI